MAQQRSIQDRNFGILYIEAFFTTFTGVAGAFTSAYAIRLGASNTEIGLMSALPQLMVILVSIPFGKILQNSTKKIALALWGISIYRMTYILFGLAPWAKYLSFSPVVLFLALYVFSAIPSQFWNIGNVGMMVAIVPEENRAQVFSIRNMIGSLASIGGLFLVGQWLSRASFPGNYQGMFFITGFISMISLICWLGIKFPVNETKLHEAQDNIAPKKSLLEQIKQMIKIFEGRPIFKRFTFNILLLNIGLWIVSPLYTIYTVRHLGASDAWIGTSSMVSSIAALIGWLLSRRFIDRWGNASVQRVVALILGVYPFLVGMTSSLTLIMIFGGIYNLLTPSYSLGSYNLQLKIFPAEQREDATAIYNTIMSIGPFLFPLLGVSLANSYGIAPTLIGCGLLAFLGSSSFWIWKLEVRNK